jgi:uncharacterized membrane protein
VAHRDPAAEPDPSALPRAERPERRTRPRPEGSPIAAIVERNIATLLERRKEEEHARSLHERVADAVTRFTGSLTFFGIHLALLCAWIAAQHASWLPHFDPHYTGLAVAASVEAIFLSTFVLITQRRMQEHADKRADLDLQISLLAEHEVTQIMMLVRDMARRMGVERAQDPALDELQRAVEPASVLDTIEASEAEILTGRRGTRRRRRR